MSNKNGQEDWKIRYDSLNIAHQKLLVRKMELSIQNDILEKRNKQLIMAAQANGQITGDHFQKQATEINKMGEEIGRLRAILRKNEIEVE